MLALTLTPTRRLLSATFVAAFVSALYLLPMYVRFASPTLLSPSALDRAVPFLDWTIWLYYSYGLFLVLPFLVGRDEGSASWTLYALMTNSMVAALIFFVWPTSVPAPQPTIGGMSGLLWDGLLTVDRPTNVFPSLHVANACVCAFALWRERNAWRSVSPVWTLLIVVSTLTTKQHFAVDLLGGAMLAAFSLWLVHTVVRRAAILR